MKKNTTTNKHINKEMNSKTYALRRKVIELIYEAKKVVDLPRLEVRITDAVKENVLGSARLGDNVIWITETAINDYDLRTVVYHEICHAVWGIKHDESCPLMKSIHSPLTKAECQKYLKKYEKRLAM